MQETKSILWQKAKEIKKLLDESEIVKKLA